MRELDKIRRAILGSSASAASIATIALKVSAEVVVHDMLQTGGNMTKEAWLKGASAVWDQAYNEQLKRMAGGR